MIARPLWLLSLTLMAALAAVAVLVSLRGPNAVLHDEPPPTTALPAQEQVVVVDVPPGATTQQVGQALFAQGVIASPHQFETLVGLLGYADRLAAGTYDFEPGLLTLEVIERIRNGVTSELVVTIPEGLQLREIIDRVAQATPLTAAALLAAAADPAIAEGALAAFRPAAASLEGYLFPSTYVISRLATPRQVLQAMLERFDEQFPLALRAEIAGAEADLHAILTIASIVEREAAVPAERPVIASVFWNRLRLAMRLEADPTVQYALAQNRASRTVFGHWKSPLTEKDLQVPSPFNTYRAPALPPTPIASPGLDSILAALRPAQTDFLFFVARGDGGHLFAETFEEHSDNVHRVQGG